LAFGLDHVIQFRLYGNRRKPWRWENIHQSRSIQRAGTGAITRC
jgi:hypothetical protein